MRITLLTVEIAADSDASKGEYVLNVPIVVRRMLEVDFAATFVNGTSFSDSSYRGSDGNYLGGQRARSRKLRQLDDGSSYLYLQQRAWRSH